MIDLIGSQIALDYKLAIVIIAVFAGGVLRGFAGFGSALIIIPALTLVFGAREAVAIEVIIEIPIMLSLVPTAIRHAEREIVVPLLLWLIVTIPLGTLALVAVDGGLMKIIISCAVLLMVVVLAMQNEIKRLLGQRGTIAAGIVSGLVQGATGVGGPPAVIALLARGDDTTVTRANVIAFTSGMVLMSIASFWLYGLLSRTVIITGLLTAPICLLAVRLGMAIFNVYGDRAMRTVALLFVALTALITLGRTLTDLL